MSDVPAAVSDSRSAPGMPAPCAAAASGAAPPLSALSRTSRTCSRILASGSAAAQDGSKNSFQEEGFAELRTHSDMPGAARSAAKQEQKFYVS